MDSSRVATHRARGVGNKRAFWGDGVSWCGWCSVAHFRIYQRVSSKVDGPYGSYSAPLLYPWSLFGISLFLGASLFSEFHHQKWSIDIFPWFPRVVGARIPFPVNEVLILRSPRPHVQYLLYFPLLFPFYQIKWGFCEVFSVLLCLLIGMEQLGVEDVVYLSMSWQLEARIYSSDCLKDLKRSVMFWA